MKAKGSLALLFALFAYGSWYFQSKRDVVPPSPTAGPDDAFSLLSWNVGYFDFEEDSRAQDADLRHIADVINEADVDCIALQEIAQPVQVKILSQLLNKEYPHHFLGKGSRTDRYVATLSKLPFEQTILIPTSVGREATAVELKPEPGGPSFTLINCHADAFNSSHRRYYVNDLMDWYLQSRMVNFVLAGDFNFDLVPVESSDLFTDNKKNDSESYSLILEYFQDVGRYGGTTASFDRRIDYIFASSNDVEAVEFRVLTGKLTGKMDHHPLWARMRLVRNDDGIEADAVPQPLAPLALKNGL